MHSRADFRLPSKKVRALALSAIEKRVASRAADLAPAIKQLWAAGNTTLHPGRWPECGGHYNSTRWQLGPDAGAPAPRSDLRRNQETEKEKGGGSEGRREAGYAPFLIVEVNSKAPPNAAKISNLHDSGAGFLSNRPHRAVRAAGPELSEPQRL
jgi:hypothetical protein